MKTNSDFTYCTGCMAEISKGQAFATQQIYATALCVKCISGFTKFESVKSWKNKARDLQIA